MIYDRLSSGNSAFRFNVEQGLSNESRALPTLRGQAASSHKGGSDEILDVNVKGLFFTLQSVAPHMIERQWSGHQYRLRVGRPTLLHYAASKAAVISIA